MEWKGHRVFRAVWWISNLLLLASLLISTYAIAWEYSVRSYLDGFSDAVVPETATPEETVQYILDWMRTGPHAMAQDPNALAKRDPEDTLNYQQLLNVCGTATNAFLNLARSSGLQVRRLLLLTPERNTKHVVAEGFLDNRWVIVDPTYRVTLRDVQGRMLTRQDLQNPVIFAQATGKIPGYLPEYDYQIYAHVRLARLPLQKLHLRRLLNFIYPGWDESTDWGLLLERRSFFVLFVALLATLFFAALRFGLGWYADHRLGLPRIRLRQKALRAGAAFFTTPEIK